MKTDTLTLHIYNELCKHYADQIKLNLDLVTDLAAEKKLHKLPYAFHNEQKSITVDTFSCKFTDAFEIKSRFDKLVQPKERFYYFKQSHEVVERVEVIIPTPAKPKRVYKARIKPPVLRLPKVSLLKQMLMYFKIK